MSEEYTKNGKKIVKVEYKIAEEIIENPINLKIERDSENYRAETDSSTSNSQESSKKPEVKREGDKRCWCGSGKKFEDCHGKHLRVDKNPGASVKEYEIKLNVRDIDEYETPKSVKEYEEEGKESRKSEEEAENEKEFDNEYKKKEKDEEES